MTQIKLCGLFREEDVAVVNQLKPEYIGLVFYKKSHRDLTFEKAKTLKNLLDPSIKAVGVFVDEDMDFVVSLVEEHIIDIAQLHGHEDDAYMTTLRERTGVPIIKAFKVSSDDEIQAANASIADYVLLDAGKGTGTSFDWDFLKGMQRDYFLAGGLYVENVKDAVAKYRPYAVDVSSGIETDKLKDPTKMQAFVSNVRNA